MGRETQIQKSMRQFRRATSAFHREIPLKSWSISGSSRSREDMADIARGGNSQPRIRRSQSAFRNRIVGGRMAIQHLNIIGQRLKAVSETFGNEQGATIFCRVSPACQCRKVADPSRKSTATSHTSPRITFTSFISLQGRRWKCIPGRCPLYACRYDLSA